MANEATRAWVDQQYRTSIVPTLLDYIRIPNLSPGFDPAWKASGHMDRAVALLAGWARAHLPEGATLEVVQLPERTPLIFIDVPATGGAAGDTVLLYGHLDKQPETTGWREGLGPWTPVLEGDRLYGRGSADDGYALFASLTAVAALRQEKRPHARCVILIEACEESGSLDLPAYIEALAARIGTPSLVVCLDSGCNNYDQLWLTTSLRGVVVGTLEVSLLTEGVHSGDASGLVASSFRVMRLLLDRLEDAKTGAILPPELSVPIPAERVRQARRVAEVLGEEVWSALPLQPGATPVTADGTELILNRTWRPALAVVGADGLPANAGNVMRPSTALKLSLRIPPGLDVAVAEARLKALFEAAPPYGAKVTWSSRGASAGWDSPPLSPWLEAAIERGSQAHFGRPAALVGEGGSIPFMHMLGKKFPQAQFLITGVLGPGSNAHGPNEFLHLPTARKLTLVVADVLAEHARRNGA